MWSLIVGKGADKVTALIKKQRNIQRRSFQKK